MKTLSLLVQLRPRSHPRHRGRRIVGALVEDFVQWLDARGYAGGSICQFLSALGPLVRWWQRCRVDTLAQVTSATLAAAHEHFRRRKPAVGQVVRVLQLFLRDCRAVRDPEPRTLLASEAEQERFAAHLRQVRGLSEATVAGHLSRLRLFLAFIGIDRRPQAIAKLGHVEIENHLRHAALTNKRHSMQHVVATLRSFLRWKHAHGLLNQPLHLQIDTPRVYQLERLPRPLPWDQVRTLLRSIDRSTPEGLRDFTMLYLVAAYGLRSCEVARLSLEDIDWRNATVRVIQTKTRQVLQLPLTDQAGDIVQRYLRKGRPKTDRRELFLRLRAPLEPLNPAAIRFAMDRWIRRGPLKIKLVGIHSVRHAFAMHLLRQGVSMKAIGDAMGHGDVRSTAVYLRLAIEDLRSVGMPVPATVATSVCLKSLEHYDIPLIRSATNHRSAPVRFRSGLAVSLQRYLAIKRALGRRYDGEKDTLLKWDACLHRFQGRSHTVSGKSFRRWTETLTQSSNVRRKQMRVVRNFLLFHARDNRVEFIPDVSCFPESQLDQTTSTGLRSRNGSRARDRLAIDPGR